MGAALDWIGWIATWIGRFFPRWMVIEQNQQALKTEGFFLPKTFRVRCGGFNGDVRLTVCYPGLHWWWPATSTFENYPTAFQTDNLPSQTVETADGQSVTVGGMISYRIADVGKLLPYCYSPTKAIQTMTLPAVHNVVCKLKWDDLKDEQRRGTLGTKLRNETKKRLSEFGVDVEGVELTDMVRTRAYRLIQSTQQDEE